MRKIWAYLKKHIREDFSIPHYLIIVILLAIAVSVNYSLDFEDKYLEPLKGARSFICYFVFYAIPYYSAVFSYCYFSENKALYQRRFWLYSSFGLMLLSLDASVPFLQPFIERFFVPDLRYWTYKVCVNMVSFITIFIPLLLLYWSSKTQQDAFGLLPKRFDVKPYFVLLLLILPLIVAASFHPSFQRQYPMYKVSSAAQYLGVDEWVTASAYEIAYGLDFITVELLFRGFFVIGMMQFLGRGSVLSMAVIYCFLHFSKPPGEAMSSIIGGFILGVVALETRSIWGGVIVHVGLAWLMELAAFIQKSLE